MCQMRKGHLALGSEESLTSLLREIQNNAVDSTTRVNELLRKCTLLAARLGNSEFKIWVENELNGYPDNESLPPYRVLHTHSCGHFAGPFGSGLRGVTIPEGCLPKKYHNLARIVYISQPISSLESLIADSESGEGTLKVPWPGDLIALVGREIYSGMQCYAAWREVPRNVVIGVVDTIRNRVLRFAIEIEAQSPDAGEAPLNNPPLPQERVSSVYHTVVIGNLGSVGSVAGDVVQTQVTVVPTGDMAALKSQLRSVGVEEKDIRELELALKDDGGKRKKIAPGPRTAGWLGRMAMKSSTGLVKAGTTVATGIVSKLIAQYLGLPP